MSATILISLVTTGAALICAALAVYTMITSRGVADPPVWAASSLGALGLSIAAVTGSVRPLDLAAVAGVVLVGGVAGAGWGPRARGVLLALGLLGFAVAFFARLYAFSQLRGSPEVLEQLTWAVARSSGFAAFLAATGAVVLGARRPSALPIGGLPARVYALHRALGIASILATGVHLVAVWADDFVEGTWGQHLFVPWTSGHRPFAATLGWLAMISLLLTAASGGLRRVIPGWRVVHALAYLTFALGLVHGLMAGSDSGSPWALVLYAATLLAVAWTLTCRFKQPLRPVPSRKEEVDRKGPLAGAGHGHQACSAVNRTRQSVPNLD
jgi:sulfoxide reductase heme-binding subunit YedZ